MSQLFFQAQSSHLPHYGGVDVHFTGMLDCFRQVIKTKGILTLWSGLTANMVKVGHAAGPCDCLCVCLG